MIVTLGCFEIELNVTGIVIRQLIVAGNRLRISPSCE